MLIYAWNKLLVVRLYVSTNTSYWIVFNGAIFLPPVEILTLLPMVIAETPGSLLSKYPRSSHNHAFTGIVLSLGKWEERRPEAEMKPVWYRMFYAMLLFRWKKLLSLRVRYELECRGLMGMSSLLNSFLNAVDNEPLEKPVGQPTDNGKLLSFPCSSKTRGRTVGSVLVKVGWIFTVCGWIC